MLEAQEKPGGVYRWMQLESGYGGVGGGGGEKHSCCALQPINKAGLGEKGLRHWLRKK